MTENALKRLLPNASKSFLKRNASNCADNQAPNPKPQRPIRDDALGAPQRKASNNGRIAVRFTSFRRRLLDPDNLYGGTKYFTDSLRYAGLIPGDTEVQIQLEVSQEKVATKEEEHTLIEIEPIVDITRVRLSEILDRPALIEAYWSQCSQSWNRQAFDAFMETLSDEDLLRYVQIGKE